MALKRSKMECSIQKHFDALQKQEEFKLKKATADMKSFVSRTDLDMSVGSMVLHIAAHCVSCNLSGEREIVVEFLKDLSDSPFLLKTTMVLISREEPIDNHSFSCMLQDVVTVFESMLSLISNSMRTVQMIGIVDLVRIKVTESCEERNNIDILDRILNIKRSILASIRSKQKSSTSVSQSCEDVLRPPESFRTISVLPTEEDIVYPPSFLRKNKKKGEYQNLEHYLDVQFRLYREDCIAPLRDVYEEFIVKDRQQNRHFRLENGRIYRNVTISRQTSTSLEHGEVYTVYLDTEHARRINWKNSKRLKYGSLLLLSFDRFKSFMFGVVAESDPQQGQFKLKIIRTKINQHILKETPGIILEATGAYFEAYYHVLSALKSITEDNFPFIKYIVNCQTEIDRTYYLNLKNENKYDIQQLLSIDNERPNNTSDSCNDDECAKKQHTVKLVTKTFDIFQPEVSWPSCYELKMDTSQRKAFISALTDEFVIIQGPPGTGKTYIGLQIAETLLRNRRAWQKTQQKEDENLSKNIKASMLIVCYSNHALDQFLQDIAFFFPTYKRQEEIVRFGSQCKNPVTESFLIKHHRRNVPNRQNAVKVIADMESKKHLILRNRALLQLFQSKNIVAKFSVIKHIIPDGYLHQLQNDNDTYLSDWLGVSVRTWFTAVSKKRYMRHGKLTQKRYLLINDEQAKENYLHQELPEGAFDDDQQFELNIDEVAVDIVTQYTSVIQTINDERCLDILTEEANIILGYLKASVKATERYMNENIQTNIWNKPSYERWKMYRYWLHEFCKETRIELQTKEQEFNALFDEYKSAKLEVDEQILGQVSVIGMTTTCAARNNELLKKVCPIITIIEEAAEVPEAHIISAINPKCEHVILIGDHKQLEPKTAVQELAVRYNLSVSLFERMIENGVKYHCLQEQHRMRPEIAELVRHIYPVLEDHYSVKEYSNIRGVKTNLFFVDHSHDELYNEEIKSYYNEHEATFIVGLFCYLLKQGYKSSNITILVAYTGQLLCMKEEIKKKELRNVKVCVLDNYQGEENDIILLSLVRSNTLGDIGFLYKENRICVALSRAKMGLFIIGNSTTLTKRSRHWKNILSKLQDIGYSKDKKIHFGEALPLYCEAHLDKVGIMAKTANDFEKSIDGGCEKVCEFRLHCGHVCPRYCHPLTQSHDKYKCQKFCMRSCRNGHVCDRMCHFPEKCKCLVLVEQLLTCGHTTKIHCFVNAKDLRCNEMVNATLKCGHSVVKKCFMQLSDILCDETVSGKRTSCGHEYERPCHQKNYESKVGCKVEVEKEFQDCLHKKRVPCSTELIAVSSMMSFLTTLNEISVCSKQIEKTLKCGHVVQILCHRRNFEGHKCTSACNNKCDNGHICKKECHFGKPCNCLEMVKKTLECGHSDDIKCSIDSSQVKCRKKVGLILERCSHKINLPCAEKTKYESARSDCIKNLIMNNYKCEKKVSVELKSCGHNVKINCWKRYELSEGTLLSSLKMECDELVDHELSTCGHTVNIPCWKKQQLLKAKERSTELLNLTQEKYFSIECTELVSRKLTLCGHIKIVPCNKLKTTRCDEIVSIAYPQCGHVNDIKCWESQTQKPNKKLKYGFENIGKYELPPCKFEYDTYYVCGHSNRITCGTKSNACCTAKCRSVQLCGHECLNSCNACKGSCIHKTCEMLCTRHLLCGHECQSLDCKKCVPCTEQCAFSCEHSLCRKACIESCEPCTEPCNWNCPHQQCTRLCHEQCDRNLCLNDCPNDLACGHKCPGYCGEPCSAYCSVCNPEKIVGLRDQKQNKVVQLRECIHCFEAKILDEYMQQNACNLLIRCPMCRTIIHKHPRYDLILKMKKILYESIKTHIRFLHGNGFTFPVVYIPDRSTFMNYVLKFQTFIQIAIYTEKKRGKGMKLETLLLFAKNTSQIVEYAQSQKPFDSVLWLSISEQILKMRIYWILSLLHSDEYLSNQTIRVSSQISDEVKCKAQEDENGSHSDNTRLYSIDDFTKLVLDILDHNHLKDAEEYCTLLVPYLKDSEAAQDAMNVPKLCSGIGIHEGEWKICRKGHAVPAIFSDKCEACVHDLPSYILAEHSLTTGLPKLSPETQGKTDTEKIKQDLRLTAVSKKSQRNSERTSKPNKFTDETIKESSAYLKSKEVQPKNTKTRKRNKTSNKSSKVHALTFHDSSKTLLCSALTEPTPQEIRTERSSFLEEHFQGLSNGNLSLPRWGANRGNKDITKTINRETHADEKTPMQSTDNNRETSNSEHSSGGSNSTTGRGRRKTKWKRIL